MKLNITQKARRRLRPSMLIGALAGLIIGFVITALFVSLRSEVWAWIIVPLFLAFIVVMFVLGFYLIFLNHKE